MGACVVRCIIHPRNSYSLPFFIIFIWNSTRKIFSFFVCHWMCDSAVNVYFICMRNTHQFWVNKYAILTLYLTLSSAVCACACLCVTCAYLHIYTACRKFLLCCVPHVLLAPINNSIIFLQLFFVYSVKIVFYACGFCHLRLHVCAQRLTTQKQNSREFSRDFGERVLTCRTCVSCSDDKCTCGGKNATKSKEI